MRIRTRCQPDFKNPKKNNSGTQWYDLEYDRILIEQSIAKQYGILPSQQGDLSYSDWAKLVSGLMDDTPLGRVVSVRCEQDKDIIKHFTADQKRIQAEWNRIRAQKLQKQYESGDGDDYKKSMQALQSMFAALAGGAKT